MVKAGLISIVLVAPIVCALVASPFHYTKKLGQPQPDAAPAMEGMPPMPPPPGEHHQWLERFVGTWATESRMIGEGAPAMECSGNETVRSIGGRWIVSDLHNQVTGMGPMHAVFTLGYNPETGAYQATWIDSVTDHLWVYDGTVDASGNVLTLEAEGPNMMDPAGGTARYRDVIEFKGPNHRTQNSYAQVNGEWVHFATSNYRRSE